MAKDLRDEERVYFRPLAYDERGMAFELKGDSTRWLVQRVVRARGRQETLYGFNRRPLQIPIESTVEDFEAALREANYELAGYRFRLVPVDAQGKQSDESCGFIVCRSEDDDDDEPRNGAVFAPAKPGPSSASFDVAAVVQAVTEGVQRTIEPTLATLRSTLDKLIAANIATTEGLLRSRVPQAFEFVEEEEDSPAPDLKPQSLADQLSQVAAETTKMAHQFMAMMEMIKRANPSTEPRNAAVGDPPLGFGHNGSGGEHS